MKHSTLLILQQMKRVKWLDDRYFKKSGGTISGITTFNNGLTSSSEISIPFLTLTSASGLTQGIGQLGEYKSFSSAITGDSIQNIS